ncbi:PIG-L deacetylase family protein [Pedosphaera parvula]|uniref:LmbE family protein n=1 Tax=Pedosphaera parvula (strain Ellin514) TaxID=320771 RepID=B9XM69_PEDPL|nr:PIG-L deacetylase family protein [Pedosphaera parvula]EEF59062.1 LmbE family protein [Pedosphaera parvula Ellin514]
MKLDFGRERVLAVVAHPDDAELLCAGTLARAKAEGAEIGVCVMCRGDKGQPSQPIKNLAAVRRREMSAAGKLLGAKLYFGESPDGELVDDLAKRLKLVEIYRQFKPTLVLAHDLADYHPDHRAAGQLAEAASWFCASRGQKTRSTAMASAPVLWWMDAINMLGFTPGFYVDVSRYAALKTEMLACHKSQLLRGDDRDFSPLSELLQLQFTTRGSESGVAAAEAFRAHLAFKRVRAW